MAQEIRLRDTRRADWFWVQNVLIDVFQPVIGPLGVTVYNTLCREVRRDVIDITLRELGEGACVSKDTAGRMLWKMQALGMVGVRPAARGRSVYVLYDLEDAAGPGETDDRVTRLRVKLAAAERGGKAPAKSQQETALEAPGLFDNEAAEISAPAVSPAVTLSVPLSVSVGDRVEAQGVSLPETACLKNRGVLSQKQGGLVSDFEGVSNASKDETRHLDKTRPNPPAGRASGDQGSQALVESSTKEAKSAPVEANETVAGQRAEVRATVRGLAGLKPRLGDVSDLREQVTVHMTAAGYAVKHDAPISDRGDGRRGTVDLWCTRGAFEAVAIELDAATPRERSLMKLGRLRATGEVHTVLLLRTGDLHYGIIDLKTILIGMGWPGNSEFKPAPRGAVEQQARAAVGAAPAATPAGSVREAGHVDAASVRRVFAALREDVRQIIDVFPDDPVVNPMAEWDLAFGSLSYERHEATATGETLMVVASHFPAETIRALKIYGERVNRALTQAFGCAVQLQVIGADTG